MPTALFYATKVLSFLAVSGSAYMLSNTLSPEVAENESAVMELPSLSVNLSGNGFSPAFAALEDDSITEADIETFDIPALIPSTPLAVPSIYMDEPVDVRLPTLTVDVSQNSSAQTTKPGAQASAKKEPAADQADKSLSAQLLAKYHWITGPIELTGGLAVTSDTDRLLLGWFVEGEERRQGSVNLRNGEYEIKVDRLVGQLIAELVDSEGTVLGESVIDLDKIARSRSHKFTISGVPLVLEPYHFGFQGQAVSVYHTDSNPDPIEDVSVNVGLHDFGFKSKRSGLVRDVTISSDSTAVITASHRDYWDTLLFSDFTSRQKIRMFPEKYMTALFETIELNRDDRTKGVVWGTILSAQRRVAGYRVRLRDTDHAAVYFALYIANPSLKETGHDGQFVFTGVNDGEYEMEVIDAKGRRVDSRLVVVRSGYVSQISVEIRAKKQLQFRAFDPLSNDPNEVYLFELGSGKTMEAMVEEPVEFPVPKGQDPVVFYSKVKGSNEETIMLAHRGKKYQSLPILNDEWWRRTRTLLGISAENGVVVGFIDSDESFQVHLENPEEARVMYFDKSGAPLDGRSGRTPSGFVVYNIGNGLHTLMIQTESGELISESAFIDGSSVSLVYKDLKKTK